MMYNKTIEDYFFQPQHTGILDVAAPLTVFVDCTQNLTQIVWYLRCTPTGIIIKTCYKVRGNPYVIAALEWMCRMIEGGSLDTILQRYFHEKLLHEILVQELKIPYDQYPVALQIETVCKDLVMLMKKKLEDISHER